jgi:dienelactone hydrolase
MLPDGVVVRILKVLQTFRIWKLGLAFMIMVSASACGQAQPIERVNTPAVVTISQATSAPTTQPNPMIETIASPSMQLTTTATWTQILPSATVTLTATPDPYVEWTHDNLVRRAYGGGELKSVEVMADNSYFTRYLVTYPSDGLTIYGFMDKPKRGEPPYPVVIALHGYIEPDIYTTLDYTTGYADTLARAGYLVIHPNLRGYRPSDDGPNLFRVGMAVDVLNLIALIKEQGGQSGALEAAQPASIGLWGHSMGGGISIRVLTVNADIRAAVLYGSMSGDERQNYEAINRWSDGQRGNEELTIPLDVLPRISPIYYVDRIRAAVSIHHGESDELVPVKWSQDLCQRLQELSVTVECFTYPGQHHTFDDAGGELFMQRAVEFFERWLE